MCPLCYTPTVIFLMTKLMFLLSALKQLGIDSSKHQGVSLKSDHSMRRSNEFQSGDLSEKKL